MGGDRLETVRRQLGDMRRRLDIRKGDELEHTLIAVEALAEAIDGLCSDAAGIIAEGERSVGMVVSAAMTRQVLWRLSGLPAVVGAVVAALVLGAGLMHDKHADGVQRDLDRAAQETAWRAERDTIEAERRVLAQERQDLAAEKTAMEMNFPSTLLDRADHLTGAARDLVQMEAAAPGFINWMARNGRATMAIARANGGSLCPQVINQERTAMCAYPKP